MSDKLLVLLIVIKFKHYIADYILQVPFDYMLKKFDKKGWYLPLGLHCLIHLVFTLSISLFYVSIGKALLLALADLVIHFTMDTIKARPSLLGRFKTLSETDFILYDRELRMLSRGDYVLREDIEKDFKMKMINNKIFWLSHGFDQLVHGLTDLMIVYFIY